MVPNTGRLVMASLVVPLWALLTSIVLAGSGDVIRTPPSNVRNTTGLNLAIDTQWVDASGYRSVRVHVATATGTPSTADRELLIELAPSSYGASEGKFIARQFVTLPQGSVSATAEVLVPQNQPWHEMKSKVFIDGQQSRQHSVEMSFSNNVGGEWSEAIPAILVIDNDAPGLIDRHEMLTRFNRNSRPFPREEKILDTRALEAIVRRSFFNQEGDARPRDMELLRRVTSAPA